MKQLGNLAMFAAELARIEMGVISQLHAGVEAIAVKVEKTAKEEIGEYQNAVGPFPAWSELADSTKADRVRQGYSENDPGLRSGEMRDSISHEAKGLEAVVGSNSDKLVWFELGTPKQPPRPVLGPAVQHNREEIKKILGGAVVKGFLGGAAIPAALKYDEKL